jgi:hypothetical protein
MKPIAFANKHLMGKMVKVRFADKTTLSGRCSCVVRNLMLMKEILPGPLLMKGQFTTEGNQVLVNLRGTDLSRIEIIEEHGVEIPIKVTG